MRNPLYFFALFLTTVICQPSPSKADELPADRRPASESRAGGGLTASGEEPLLLPEIQEDPDAGSRSWASADAATIRREAHLRIVAAAYGAAGTFTGMSLYSFLIAHGQETPGTKQGWRYAGWTTAGLAGGALITGTILWALTPPAPGRPRLAAGPGVGLALALSLP